MRKTKNPNRVAGGRRSAAKNKWIAHVKACRAKRGESYKRALSTCRSKYKGRNAQFNRELALAAFEKGSFA